MNSEKAGSVAAPAEPASTTVVHPLPRQYSSGGMPRVVHAVKTWTCVSMSPGQTTRPVASKTVEAVLGSICSATALTLPQRTATSITASRSFAGSTTRPPRIRTSWRCSSVPKAFMRGPTEVRPDVTWLLT